LGVLIFGTLQGTLVAIVMSLIGLASQTVSPPVYFIGRKRDADVLRPLSPDHPEDEIIEGLLIARPEGRIYFLNAQNVVDKVNALVHQYQPEVVVLDMSRVPDSEYSALQILIEEEKRLAERDKTLWLAALNPGVLKVVRHSSLSELLEKKRLLFNARSAIKQFQALQENTDEI
jgi:SulP family sulfate permease